MATAQTLALIDRLFERVGQPDALNAGLADLRECFNARQALIQTSVVTNRQLGVNFAASGVNEASLIEYHVHFEAEDVWTRQAVAQKLIFEGSVARGATLVPRDQLIQTRFWRDFLARHEIVDILSGVLELPADAPPTVVTLHRAGQEPPFEAADEQQLRELLPHLRRALALQRRLAPQLAVGRSMQELFDQMALPMGFIDDEGRLQGGNRAFETALTAAEFCRQDATGPLQWRSPDWELVTPALNQLRVRHGCERLLAAASGRACVGSLLAARGSFRPLQQGQAVQALLSLRPLEPARDAVLLRQHFGLSPTELRVALLLDCGQSAEAVAGELQVKLPTIRTHIARLLDKTSATHQLQMLARLRGH